MAPKPREPVPVDLQSPLAHLSDCHVGITEGLDALAALPPLLEPARRAREIATQATALFDEIVLTHHAEEEARLFPAVLRASEAGPERERMRMMVDQLVLEHRRIEHAWRMLEPRIASIARGGTATLLAEELQALCSAYRAHARFEEEAFLPSCQAILSRQGADLGLLGLSLHMHRRLVDDGI